MKTSFKKAMKCFSKRSGISNLTCTRGLAQGVHVLIQDKIAVFPEIMTTVKPLYSGHHRDFEKVSVIRRCPLYRGIFPGKLSLGTLKSVRYKELSAIKDVCCREVSLYFNRLGYFTQHVKISP